MPTKADITRIGKVLSIHALGPTATRQRQALEHIFKRIVEELDRGTKLESIVISPQEIIDLPIPPGEKEPENPTAAVHGLKRDICYRIDAFYGEGDSQGKLPHHESQKLEFRVEFTSRGNYMPRFRPYRPKQPEADLVPFFWSPHLPPNGIAKILYPEPLFLIDEHQTHFRNTAIGTGPDKSALKYLNIPGSLKTGYSYVSAGVVQAMITLAKALRICNREYADPNIPECKAVTAYSVRPEDDSDFILLSPPSSTRMVDALQGGLRMTVDARGIDNAGKCYPDNNNVQWGIVTRMLESDRTVTLLTAKHGRSIEAMAKYLTRHKQLQNLAQGMKVLNKFPETFQVLFRMPTNPTPDGPFVNAVSIEEIYIPEIKHSEDELSSAELSDNATAS